MKKYLSILILAGMALHCSSRLGVLSMLYENRYDIMVALKVIPEKPIPMCDKDYFAGKHLVTSTDDQGPNLYIAVAHEINLFSPTMRLMPEDRLPDGLSHQSLYRDPLTCTNPHLDIFHPPMS